MDFDSAEIENYPEIHKQVVEGTLEPGIIEIEDKLAPIYTVSYQKMVEEFERIGATRVSSKAS